MIETLDREQLQRLSNFEDQADAEAELDKMYNERERQLKLMQKKINRRGMEKKYEDDPDAEGFDLWKNKKPHKYQNIKVELSKENVMVDLKPS